MTRHNVQLNTLELDILWDIATIVLLFCPIMTRHFARKVSVCEEAVTISTGTLPYSHYLRVISNAIGFWHPKFPTGRNNSICAEITNTKLTKLATEKKQQASLPIHKKQEQQHINDPSS